jgi:hypothetical protein
MRLAMSIGGAAVAAAAAWAGFAGLEPCRWLDRLFGISGCAAAWEVSDLTALRRTMAFRPGAPSTLVLAGVTRVERFGYGGLGQARLVLFDVAAGRETARYDVEPGGLIEQLALSPDGRFAAITCNRYRGCDVAPADVPEGIDPDAFVPVGLVDLDDFADQRQDGVRTVPDGGTGWWIRGLSRRDAPANADGTSVEVRFSFDGSVLAAGTAAWTVAGGAPAPLPADLVAPAESLDRAAIPGGEAVIDRQRGTITLDGPAGRIPLDLPDGFIPEAHVPLAVSPDGAAVAVLARRFAGPGTVRAVLSAWRIADGTPLLRRLIDDDLYAPLAWTPDGTRLLVAVASPPAARGHVELRAYAIGGES